MNQTTRRTGCFGNSLIAFIGALLMAEVWKPSEGTVKLLFFFEVPNYTGFVLFLIIAALFCLSFLLALASIWSPIRDRVSELAAPLLASAKHYRLGSVCHQLDHSDS